MPYIGKEPEHGNYQLLDALTAPSGVFDGSRTVFNLTADSVAVYPTSPTTLIISLGGVLQEPNSSYTVSGNQITFTTAPATGTNFFGVSLGDTLDIGTPSDGSVTVAKMAANSVDSAQYVDGSIDLVHMSAESVDSNQYVDGSIDNVHLATGIDAVKLADGSVTNAELQYINSLSSNAQTQISAKQATIDSSARLDASLIGANGNVSNTEYGYLNGVTSAIQTQIDAAGGPTEATEAVLEQDPPGSSTANTYISPEVAHFHPGVAKCWANLRGTDTFARVEDYNVAGITDNATGNYKVTFATGFSSAGQAVVLGVIGESTARDTVVNQNGTQTTGLIDILTSDAAGTAKDCVQVSVAIFGAQ